MHKGPARPLTCRARRIRPAPARSPGPPGRCSAHRRCGYPARRRARWALGRGSMRLGRGSPRPARCLHGRGQRRAGCAWCRRAPRGTWEQHTRLQGRVQHSTSQHTAWRRPKHASRSSVKGWPGRQPWLLCDVAWGHAWRLHAASCPARAVVTATAALAVGSLPCACRCSGNGAAACRARGGCSWRYTPSLTPCFPPAHLGQEPGLV